MGKLQLCVGTRKGAFILSTSDRNHWEMSEPILFGQEINHFVPDPRDPNKMLIAARTGHLGPTLYRSEDGGNTWKEASHPPKFPSDSDKSVKNVFWITPGHSSQEGTWFAGTIPQQLFITRDHGDTWEPFDDFNRHPLISEIIKDNFGTPAGPLLHSINIDPRDPNRMILALSSGGCFITTDGGKEWKPRNENVLADFMPDPYPVYGQCVHNMQMHPKNPDLVYQQNHCGVYKINMTEDKEWSRIGENIPKEIGDIGFPLILHPEDHEKLWVFPMDSTSVWPRTSIDGKPAVYHSRDGGETWIRQDKGLPQKNAWFTILRQASCHDSMDPLGIYFGTKSGEIWASDNEGNNFRNIAAHLPEVYSLEAIAK